MCIRDRLCAALPAAAHSVGGLAHTVGGGVVGVGPHGGAVSRLDDSARGDGAHAHPARRLGMDTAFQSAVFGGGMVSGAAHAVPGGHDGVGLSRGALLSSAGDRSPDGLAPTRLLFSPLTEARKRRSGFEPDPESAPSLSSARKLLAGDAPWMSPGETARRGSHSAGVFMHVTDHSLAGQPPAPRAGAAAAGGGAGPAYARKDHSLASITDRIVGEFDASNGDAVGGGRAAVVKNPDGSVQRHSGSTAPWHGNVPVDALAERLGVKRRRLYT